MDKLLLFGGSFDPIHHGHLIVARCAAERLGAGRVCLLPGADLAPHKTAARLASAADRVAMCRLAAAGEALFEVSDWEASQPGPNYTIATVRHFRGLVGPRTELYWLIGMDSLHELHSWRNAGELVELCTIVTAARPGFSVPEAAVLALSFSAGQVEKLLAHVLETPRIDISSTDIRARIRGGSSTRYLAPEAVCAHAQRVYGKS